MPSNPTPLRARAEMTAEMQHMLRQPPAWWHRTEETTAHHEAGHAVAAVLQGLEVDVASIVTDELPGTSGHVLHSRGAMFTTSRAVALQGVVVLWSGLVAESVFRSRRFWPGSHFDVQNVLSVIRGIEEADTINGYPPPEGLRGDDLAFALLDHAGELLSRPDNWDAVEAVARALLVAKRLDAHGIKAILEELPGAGRMTRRAVFVEPVRPDTRAWRQVVAYDDVPALLRAVDVLECGHRVACVRQPGGRKVVGHQEPCPDCMERPS